MAGYNWQFSIRSTSSGFEMEVSIFEYFQPFSGSFKGKQYCSDYPPSELFRNNMSCKPFADFVRSTLLDRLASGAVSLIGKVGEVDPPHLVLPLTVEPTKPRLCHGARFWNLWMRDMPFKLDTLLDLPRYVGRDTYQTILWCPNCSYTNDSD